MVYLCRKRKYIRCKKGKKTRILLLLALATMPDANDGDVPAALRAASSVPWKQARFYHGVERVRDMCGVPKGDRGDDAVIGMMLDRFGWDYERTAEMYQVSVRRRKELGMAAIKDDIVSQQLSVEDFPHHRDVMPVIPVFASTSLEPPTAAAAAAAEPGSLPVIGCYELRYGQGDPDRRESSLVTPSDFTRYMLYVTQWRWLQCERYAQRHGEIGLWSMVHDLSCPSGFFSLWSRARSVFNKCAWGLRLLASPPPRHTHPARVFAGPAPHPRARALWPQVPLPGGGGVRRPFPSDGSKDPHRQRTEPV